MQTIVGVLRGGPSREHDVSLRSGAAMLKNLDPERYDARDIYIDRNGRWHDRGRQTSPERVLRQIDVALLPLHGEYGEQGEVQRLMERYGVPYSGPDAFGAHLAMHKVIAKSHAREQGLLTPDFRYIERPEDSEEVTHDVIRNFEQPVVVKPIAWGSSVGVSVVGGYAQVLSAVQKLFEDGATGVFVEERIRGREATAGVVEGLRGEKLYSLPTVEIIPPAEAGFFAAHVKYTGRSQEICPGHFTRVENEELQRMAKVMHRALQQRHYSRSDFMVTPKGIYFLETNSAPAVGLTPVSLLPRSLAAVGVSFSDFLTHLVNLLLGR
jgi:D-alanine-D-alanine ligase